MNRETWMYQLCWVNITWICAADIHHFYVIPENVFSVSCCQNRGCKNAVAKQDVTVNMFLWETDSLSRSSCRYSGFSFSIDLIDLWYATVCFGEWKNVGATAGDANIYKHLLRLNLVNLTRAGVRWRISSTVEKYPLFTPLNRIKLILSDFNCFVLYYMFI